MRNVKKWYAERIDRGELNLSGWSRDFSQKLRWETNLRMMEAFLGWLETKGPLAVVDFGCGTGGFLHFLMSNHVKVSKYYGIEMREDALSALKLASAKMKLGNVIAAMNEIPEEFVVQTDVLVCNAAYGFKEQSPHRDLTKLKEVFKPRVMVVDFFSELRPYEPELDSGYLAYHPHVLTEKLCSILGTTRFILDHSMMPHAFTLGLGFDATPWSKEEKARAGSL